MPTVTYTGRRECMHGGCDDLPANLAEHGGAGVDASVEKIYAMCSRAENDGRARSQGTCAVPTICMKFQHRLSPSSVFMPESTESELSASQERHNAALSVNEPVPRWGYDGQQWSTTSPL